VNTSYDPHHGESTTIVADWSVSHMGNPRERRCTMLAGVWWVIIQRVWCEPAQRVAWAYFLTTMRGDIIYQSRDPYPTTDEAAASALAHASNIAMDIIEDAQGGRS